MCYQVAILKEIKQARRVNMKNKAFLIRGMSEREVKALDKLAKADGNRTRDNFVCLVLRDRLNGAKK